MLPGSLMCFMSSIFALFVSKICFKVTIVFSSLSSNLPVLKLMNTHLVHFGITGFLEKSPKAKHPTPHYLPSHENP